ncbi:DNA helicase [Cronobacter phage vB_Cdu_VP8]|nr:DNA helicase [Cronobacter phage vB_Cdu_VP8]
MSLITEDMLTKGQLESFESFKAHVQRNGVKRQHLCINGPAGTGKSTLVKFLFSWLLKQGISGVYAAAPTHAAKRVLAELIGQPVQTIQSLLKINPVTYEENQIFQQKKMPDLSKARVLFCDEASFYDKALFDILMNSLPSWCVIIALGDKDQIKPVSPGDSETSLSPFFSDKRFDQCFLTEVKRSGDGIIQVATDVRNGSDLYPNVINGTGVFKHESLNGIFAPYFDLVKTPEDLLANRWMAYTNKSVDMLNRYIRRKVYKTDKPFIHDEVIVMQEPYMVELKLGAETFKEVIFSNGEQLRILQIQKMNRSYTCRGVNAELDLSYHRLEVESLDEDNSNVSWIQVIVDDNEMQRFQMFLAKVATEYKNTTGKKYWQDFWELKNQFQKIKALPAQTFHKSQGSTYDNAFMYLPCMSSVEYFDPELAKQLKYVGLTRPRYSCHYVG